MSWFIRNRGNESKDEEGAISWSHISNAHHHNIDQGPNTEAPETEELSNAGLPVTQVEPIYVNRYILSA